MKYFCSDVIQHCYDGEENTLTLSNVGSELEHIFREAGITSMDQLRSEHILTTIHDIRRVIMGPDPPCWNASKRRVNARVYNIICALDSSDEVNYGSMRIQLVFFLSMLRAQRFPFQKMYDL